MLVIAPHGVRGDLRILPQTDFPERFMHMDACYIDGKEYHVASARFHKQFVLASFKEIPDRNAAELFAKKEIQVRREDLQNCQKVATTFLISSVLRFKTPKVTCLVRLLMCCNLVLMMSMWFPKMGEPDQLFAAIEEVVKDIDVENKLMIVDPPEWI